jgi:putative ABC transport system ATP-binding protein
MPSATARATEDKTERAAQGESTPAPTPAPLVRIRGLAKDYDVPEHDATREVHALRGVDLDVARGEFLAIVGRSGCGKSTLLNLLGGIDKPNEGTLLVDGVDVGRLSEKQLTQYRRATVGIVFQFFNLLPLLTVLENTTLPALLAGAARNASTRRAQELLESVGLSHRIHQQASLLSGGEMQRVALARALINDPPLLLADEPTGNLDSTSAELVLKALRTLTQERTKTVIMVTHSREAAAVADRIREMRDGVFIERD